MLSAEERASLLDESRSERRRDVLRQARERGRRAVGIGDLLVFLTHASAFFPPVERPGRSGGGSFRL